MHLVADAGEVKFELNSALARAQRATQDVPAEDQAELAIVFVEAAARLLAMSRTAWRQTMTTESLSKGMST